MKNKMNIRFIVTGALIAALYVALTFISNIFSLAYGPIQLRLSEILTVLPVFTPAAIPGLTIGCFIANIASFNLLDMIFGTTATLISAILCFCLKKIKFRDIPLLSFFPAVIINAVIIGAEIAWFFLPEGFSAWGFIISGIQVGVGQLIVCYIFGVPFYLIIKKYGVFKTDEKY